MRITNSNSNKWDAQYFTWSDISNAPEVPGLYAWYMTTTLRGADLDNEEDTRKNLKTLANQLRYQELEITAAGNLSLSYSGLMRHCHLGCNDDFTDLIDKVFYNKSERKLFSSILELSTPFFSPPLYIGVTKNLNNRLLQHKQEIMSSELPAGNCFAKEARVRGITGDKLSAFTFTCTDPSIGMDDARETFEAVETVLNRLYHPILGRR